MRSSGKITVLCFGALCAVFAGTPLRGQAPEQTPKEIPGQRPGAGLRRPITKALLDSLANPATAEGGSVMRFDRKHIDGGQLGEDDAPTTYTYRWRNEGTKPLVITRVETTCGCAAPSYGKAPIRPGGEGTVTVTYRPKGHPGTFQRKIFVFTQLSNKQPTAVLELTGHVTPSILPTADYPFAMGGLLLKQRHVHIDGKRLRMERIECLNAGGKPLRITADKRLLPPSVAFACEPETIPAGETADLVIRFDPGKVSGSLPEQIPILLEGVDLPPGQRTIRIRIGENE